MCLQQLICGVMAARDGFHMLMLRYQMARSLRSTDIMEADAGAAHGLRLHTHTHAKQHNAHGEDKHFIYLLLAAGLFSQSTGNEVANIGSCFSFGN